MTIEQMAEHYANRVTGYSKHDRWYEAKKDYIEAATEQQEIVIKRACDWLKANTFSFRSDEFLEPLVNAMKGE